MCSLELGNSYTDGTVYVYADYELKDNEFLKDVKSCVTYTEIKELIKRI